MKFMSSYTVANSKMLNNSSTSTNSSNKLPQIAMIQPYKNNMKMRQINNQNQNTIPINPQPKLPEKKVVWGPAVWYALHTLSVKVKEEDFQKVRTELLEIIYLTCTHLPCPDCAQHAKDYLDKINFKNIKTKEDLKVMLYQFHNDVNKRKGYPQFEYEKVDEIYSKANTVPILQNFISHFQDRKYRSIKLIATDLHRSLLCNDFKKWFTNHLQHFDA